MKIRIVGSPIPPSGKVFVDVPPTMPFSEVLTKAEAAAGVGSLAEYAFVICEVVDKKVKPVANADPSSTPAAAKLAQNGTAILQLKKGGATPRGPVPPIKGMPQGQTGRSYRDRILAMYQKYEPSKVGTVDDVLAKFQGQEEAVMGTLVKKYGPEPPAPEQPQSPQSMASPASSNRAGSPSGSSTQRSYKERVKAMYEKYEPSKVGTVDATLAKFKGKEEAVIATLVKKYGPEPEAVATPQAPATPAPTTPRDGASNAGTPAATPRTRSYRDRVKAMYEKYEPSKVGTVDATLAKFKGKEEAVMKTLIKKYGPEPEVEEPAPVAPTQPPTAEPEPATPEPTAAPEPEPEVEQESTPPPAKEEQPVATEQQIVKEQPTAPAEDSLSVAPTPGGGSSAAMTPMDTPRDVAPAQGSEEPTAETQNASQPGSSQPAISGAELLKAVEKARARTMNLQTRAIEAFIKVSISDPLSRAYFNKWRSIAEDLRVAKMAKDCIANGMWIEEGNGVFLLAGSEPPLRVPSVVEKVREWRSQSQDAADPATQKAIVSKVRAIGGINPALPVVESSTLLEILSGVEAKICDDLPKLQNENTELREVVGNLGKSKAALEDKVTAMQAKVDKSDALQESLDETKKAHCVLEGVAAKREEQLTTLQKQHDVLVEKHAKIKTELVNERKGIPTELEAQLAAKDQKLAESHQQLAKLRTMYRGAREQESALRQQVEELSTAATPRQYYNSKRGGDSARARSTSRERLGITPRLTLRDRQGSTSPPQYQDVHRDNTKHAAALHLIHSAQRGRSPDRQGATPYMDKEFEPEDNKSQDSDDPDTIHNERSGSYNDMLGAQVSSRNGGSSVTPDANGVLPPLPDRGPCPVCSASLTAFYGDQFGDGSTEDAAKVAFCFSCRRSFTAKDLKVRDQQLRNTNRTAGGAFGRARTPRQQ